MRAELIEIYSDATNAVVIRHPGRRFPGVLVQGDTLHSLVRSLEQARRETESTDSDSRDALDEVIEQLQQLLGHYKAVLAEHDIELPFDDPPRA